VRAETAPGTLAPAANGGAVGLTKASALVGIALGVGKLVRKTVGVGVAVGLWVGEGVLVDGARVGVRVTVGLGGGEGVLVTGRGVVVTGWGVVVRIGASVIVTVGDAMAADSPGVGVPAATRVAVPGVEVVEVAVSVPWPAATQPEGPRGAAPAVGICVRGPHREAATLGQVTLAYTPVATATHRRRAEQRRIRRIPCDPLGSRSHGVYDPRVLDTVHHRPGAMQQPR